MHGEVQEWLNWPLSKSGESQDSEGSNPSLSAIDVYIFPKSLVTEFLLVYCHVEAVLLRV